MAKNKINNYFHKFLIIAVGSFLLGAIVVYILISKTNLIPLNYHSKYMQLHDSNKTPRTEVYIDFFNNFLISYPEYLHISNVYPSIPTDEDREAGGQMDLMYLGNSEKFATIGVTKYDNKFSLEETMKKRTDSYAIDNRKAYNQGWKFSHAQVDGHEAVIGEFEVTQAIYDQLPDYLQVYNDSGAPPVKNNKLPVGYKKKVVYVIKDSNHYLYISGLNLSDLATQEAFDNVVSSLKFLF